MTRPRALVTGASTGIGAAIAARLVATGHDLVIAALDPDIHRVAAELARDGATVTPVQVDLREPAEVEALYAAATAGAPLDVAVLNAGVGVGGGTFVETSLSGHLDVVRLNVASTVQLAGLVAAGMAQRRAGRLLITSSLVAAVAGPYQTTYNASKAFLANFAEGLRYELRASGVTVTTLLPGPVDTGFFALAGMSDTLLGRMPKESPDLVADQAVRGLLAGRPSVVGGRFISRPAAVLFTVLPRRVRTRVQAAISRPPRRI
jgi:short-subunit dehydrogenase